jgi:hypothetical protein
MKKILSSLLTVAALANAQSLVIYHLTYLILVLARRTS